MAIEIERKFLIEDINQIASVIVNDSIEEINICQGYLSTNPEVRVRTSGYCTGPLSEQKCISTLTVKSPSSAGGLQRFEYEYEIPFGDANLIMFLCENRIIKKTRYKLNNSWEIDVYQGELSGLIIAEFEMKSAEEVINLPYWLGKEVTTNPDYKNSSLASKGLFLVTKAGFTGR